MTQPDWPERLARVVADEVRRHRQRLKLSAQHLADRTAELGMPLSRSTIANFESGRRPTVSVAELVVLGAALDVPPVTLLFPIGHVEAVEWLPGEHGPVWDGLRLFTGEWGSGPDVEPWTMVWRVHEGEVHHLAQARERLRALRMKVTRETAVPFPDEDSIARCEEDIRFTEASAGVAKYKVRRLRDKIRQAGLIPPPLPSALADVDEDSQDQEGDEPL